MYMAFILLIYLFLFLRRGLAVCTSWPSAYSHPPASASQELDARRVSPHLAPSSSLTSVLPNAFGINGCGLGYNSGGELALQV